MSDSLLLNQALGEAGVEGFECFAGSDEDEQTVSTRVIPVTVTEEQKERTVRSQATGDKIFLIKEGKRFWIKNPETLHALGFEFGQETEIKSNYLFEYEDGGSVDLKQKETGEQEVVYTEAHKPSPVLNYRRSA